MKTHRLHNRQNQQGLTLVELLVALVLSIFLLFAATTMLTEIKQATRYMEASSRLMENGRTATELLNRSVRMARYWGCAGVDANQAISHHDESRTAQSNVDVNGYDQQGIFGIDGTTDEIIVYQALDDSVQALALDVNLGVDDPVTLNPGHNVGVNDLIAINDCTQGDIVKITAVNTVAVPNELAYGDCGDSCSRDYLSNAQVLKIQRSRYYLDTGDAGGLSLFVEDPDNPNDTPEELIEGVEDMQITYGIDCSNLNNPSACDPDGVADRYVSPAAIKAHCEVNGSEANDCWRKVTSVRIALLMRSVENTLTKSPQTYYFNGAEQTATDRRLRREFFTVVALRNYRPGGVF